MNTNCTPAVIGYYEAMELLLRNARKVGEYRTHFGLLHEPEDGHCFIRNVSLPHKPENDGQRRKMQASMRSLEQKLFDDRLKETPQRIADVGFGTGGALHYLATHYPQHDLSGININPIQHHLAQQYLADFPRTELHNEDFLEFQPETPFDVLYFIESAFHINPKPDLVQQISRWLKPGGEVFLVDIFYEENLYHRLSQNQGAPLFSYLPISKWLTLFARHDIHVSAFEDLSLPIANYCKITTPEEDFLGEIVPQLIPPQLSTGIETLVNFKKVYHGYKRLSRQLKKGMLKYGILRLKKQAA